MDFLTDFASPPRRHNPDGAPRRVGVEIEFAAVSAREGADVIRSTFGGTVREEDPHRFHVEETDLGDFVCELDMQYAHDEEGRAVRPQSDADEWLSGFRQGFFRVLGDVSALVVPCEVVCPPIDHARLPELESLVSNLIRAGATGTRSNPLYAFGMQLNAEVAESSADYIASVLKAYLMLSPWLRQVMAIDMTRRLFAYANPFPDPYARQLLDPDYWPDLDQLIGDYLKHNPTRNRELDMLPLFSHLRADTVRAAVDDPRVKARPAFHYRLPDANIGERDWGLSLEWNRWLAVERVADDRDLLDRMCRRAVARQAPILGGNWAMECSQFLVLS
ncbi:MAG: amidoligase family protein [Alphaproteobacteria bacterium]